MKDFLNLVADICRGWDDGKAASEDELDALQEAAQGATRPELRSAVIVLSEHGNPGGPRTRREPPIG
jgi:hypothetical protein